MTLEIRAAVAREAHKPLSIETLRLDSPRPDEVLVELVGSGICHTDLAVVHQTLPIPMPIVLGHEGAGRVAEVGSEVTDLKPGDAVVITFGVCGDCEACAHDHPAYCAEYAQRNFAGRRKDGSPTITDLDGAPVGGVFHGQSSFATFALAQRRSVVKVREDAPLELLGGLGCGFQTGAGAVTNVIRPRQDATLAVLGAGALGFAALFAAKAAGVERIVAVDRVASRLKLARELGATHVVDTSMDDAAEAYKALGGLDYIVETTGAPAAAQPAIAALNACGVCTLMGGGAERMMSIDMMALIRGKVIRGVVEGDAIPQRFIPQLVDEFLAGRFPIDRLSKTYRFEDINQAVEDTTSGATIKPVLTF